MPRRNAFRPYVYLLLAQLLAGVTALLVLFLIWATIHVASMIDIPMTSGLFEENSFAATTLNDCLIWIYCFLWSPITGFVVSCVGVTAMSLLFTAAWHGRTPRRSTSARTKALAIGGLVLTLAPCVMQIPIVLYVAMAAGCVLWPVLLGWALPGFEPQPPPLPDSVVCKAAPMPRRNAFRPYVYLLLMQLVAAVTALALLLLAIEAFSGLNQPVSMIGLEDRLENGMPPTRSSYFSLPAVAAVVCGVGVTAVSLSFTAAWHSRTPRHKPSARTRTLAILGLALTLVPLCVLTSMITVFVATAAGCVLWPVLLGWALPGFEPKPAPQPNPTVCEAAETPNGGAQ